MKTEQLPRRARPWQHGVQPAHVLPVAHGASLSTPPKRWVAVRLCGGAGNRCFQRAALHAYAKASGRTPVVLASAISSNEHGTGTEDGACFFPALPTLNASAQADYSSTDDITIVQEVQEMTALLPPPAEPHARGVLLEGYFQAWAIATAGVFPASCTRYGAHNDICIAAAVDGAQRLHVFDAPATVHAAARLVTPVDDSYVGAAIQSDAVDIPAALAARVTAAVWGSSGDSSAASATEQWEGAAFVHVRRGDYATAWGSYGSQCLPLSYYIAALRQLVEVERELLRSLVLLSDDIRWIEGVLRPALHAAGFLQQCVRIVIPTALVRGEDVAAAAGLCERGGVLSNSSLSLWGAMLQRERQLRSDPSDDRVAAPHFFVPTPWFTFAEQDIDIYPPWATRLAVPDLQTNGAHLSGPNALYASTRFDRCGAATDEPVEPSSCALPDVIVINLPWRSDRWDAWRSAWASIFPHAQRMDAIATPERPATGCMLSHAAALAMLARPGNTADMIIVFEDDAMPTAVSTPANWATTLRALRDVSGWNLYYGGPNLDHGLSGGGAAATEDVINSLVPVLSRRRGSRALGGYANAPADTLFAPMKTVTMAHCVVYHRRALAHLAAFRDAARTSFADRWWTQHHPGTLLVSHAYYATQAPGRSDIERCATDYSDSSNISKNLLHVAARRVVVP